MNFFSCSLSLKNPINLSGFRFNNEIFREIKKNNVFRSSLVTST